MKYIDHIIIELNLIHDIIRKFSLDEQYFS